MRRCRESVKLGVLLTHECDKYGRVARLAMGAALLGRPMATIKVMIGRELRNRFLGAPSTDTNLAGVAYNGSRFVAVGQDGTILTSP